VFGFVSVHIYIYIYRYVQRDREGEGEGEIIYIYIYIYMPVHILCTPTGQPLSDPRCLPYRRIFVFICGKKDKQTHGEGLTGGD
jgi:hypothetical protein